MATRLTDGRHDGDVPRNALRKGDIVMVSAGEFIPADGEIDRGRRQRGRVGDHRRVGARDPRIRRRPLRGTGGTRVLSDWIKIRITANPGETFLDRMIALVEGAERQKTPNEIALAILLAVLTLVFLLRGGDAQPFALVRAARDPLPVLIALLVCLIPTTIGALISAIGIAGMDRLVQHNVLAMSGRSVEAAGDVDTLLLDKTGTITLGNRQATAFLPVTGVAESRAGGRGPARLALRRDARGALHRRAGEGAVRHPRARAADQHAASSCRSPPRPACPA